MLMAYRVQGTRESYIIATSWRQMFFLYPWKFEVHCIEGGDIGRLSMTSACTAKEELAYFKLRSHHGTAIVAASMHTHINRTHHL